MTYMSIPDGLAPLVENERLICLPSLMLEYDTVRQIYASQSVADVVFGPFAEDGSDDHFVQFREHLDGFLEGGFISVSEKPHDHGPETMLARVHPVADEIWDQRSVAPHPGIRCLGGFWEHDIFIALHWDFRENIVWDRDIVTTKEAWQTLFNEPHPQKRNGLDAYLSNYYLC